MRKLVWLTAGYTAALLLAHYLLPNGALPWCALAVLALTLAALLWKGKGRAIALLLVFMAMTGFTPSVVRAGVMQAILLFAPLLRREYDAPTGLAAALLLILLPQPQAIGSISLQLSFAAMAGITLLTPRIYAWMHGAETKNGILRTILSALAASLGAMVFTVPLTALHFGFVSLYAPLSNLLCLWAVSLIFLLGYVICLLGSISLPLGMFLGRIAAWIPRYLFLVARLVGKLPFAALYTRDNYVAWWIAFVYVVFLLAWLTKGKGRMRPVLPLCACVSLLIAVSFLRLDSLERGELLVTAVDVGQGQSIVVQQRDSAVVIDCGGMNIRNNAGERTAAYLASQGKREVDLLVLTHLHADHVNGVETLMEMTDVRRLALPADASEDTGYRESILALAEKKGTEIYYVTTDMQLTLGDLALYLFPPLGGVDVNERGVIALGQCGAHRFLVTGDADAGTETILTALYELPPVDLLVVGHHGSRFSTCTELLDEVTPRLAFISVGYNTYGHPHDSVLTRLAQYGVRVYRTDLDGTISLTLGRDDG